MFELYLCIFNFVIEINFRKRKKEDKTSCRVDFDDDNVDVNADINVKGEYLGEGENNVKAETSFSDVNKDVEEPLPEMSEKPSEISLRANLFAEELASKKIDENGLYDIDEDDELPQYAFSPDVEIITDEYEKEVEDTIEGRR